MNIIKTTLGEICRFEYGKSLPERNRIPGNINVYGSNGIVGKHVDSYTLGKTIIIGRKGSIGEIQISAEPCWPIDTTYYIDQSCSDCDLYWLSFILKYLKLGELNKASGVPGLNRDDAYEKVVYMPKLISDQKQAASKLKAQLAEVEKARKAVEEQIKKVDLLINQTFAFIFTDLESTPKYKIEDFAETTSGSTPPRSQKKYWAPPDIPWIKTGEVTFHPITKSEEYISTSALEECSLRLLPQNTVLVAMYGQGKTRGQSAILKIEATINQACFAILPNDTWEPEFMYLWLRHSYQHLRDLSADRGGNQANLNGTLMKSFEVPAPPSNIQKDIVKKINLALGELDIIKEQCITSLLEVGALSNSILSHAFIN